ncbi:hypothetical protein V5O48_013309, partial [Marasmius crinis-equi]
MAPGPGGKDPWLAFAKSVVLLTGSCAPVPGLQPATQALVALVTLCEQVVVNRNETRQLCIRCHDLLEAVLKYKPSSSHMLETAYDDVGGCITKVWQRVATWAQLSWGRSLVRLKKIQEDIEHSKVAIQDCFNKFQLAAAADNNQWQSEFADAARGDHEEVIAYLSEIQHGQEIANEIMRVYGEQMMQGQEGISKDVKQVMVMMQS